MLFLMCVVMLGLAAPAGAVDGNQVLVAKVTRLEKHWGHLAALGWGLLCAVEARFCWSDECAKAAREAGQDAFVVSDAGADALRPVALAARAGRLARGPAPPGGGPATGGPCAVVQAGWTGLAALHGLCAAGAGVPPRGRPRGPCNLSTTLLRQRPFSTIRWCERSVPWHAPAPRHSWPDPRAQAY